MRRTSETIELVFISLNNMLSQRKELYVNLGAAAPLKKVRRDIHVAYATAFFSSSAPRRPYMRP